MVISHLHSVDPETAPFGSNAESVEDDNGLRDDLLWETEQDAGGLGELGAGEAERAL